MIIAVDFDGTVVEHAFPDIGAPAPGAIEWIKRWHAAGARIILWTMRSGESLTEAHIYLTGNGIELFGVNNNPEQHEWTSSPKAYAHLYVDDAAFGTPTLKMPGQARPVVDWGEVGPSVLAMLLETPPIPAGGGS